MKMQPTKTLTVTFFRYNCDTAVKVNLNRNTGRIQFNFFLNLRVSRTKFENLKRQIGVTFGKFVTSWVQKLKIAEVFGPIML